MVVMVYRHHNTLVRQKQIVSAARKLIVKYGSEHVTVRRVAEEIGVSEAAIYRHFKSKRDVLSFLVDDIEDTLLSDLAEQNPDKSAPVDVLEKIMKGDISAVEQRRGVSFQVIAEIISFGDKKLNKKVYDIIEKYISRIEKIISEGVKAGIFRQDIDPHAAATLYFSMIQGLVNIWALSSYEFNLEQRYQSVWDVFRQSVEKR